MSAIRSKAELTKTVRKAVKKQPVYDIHTHLYDKAFADLQCWGIDDLLTYHYLIAEALRQSDIAYEDFWALGKPEQAAFIWQTLFVDHSPISEATRGVLTCLDRLGIRMRDRSIEEARSFFDRRRVDDYIDTVFDVANVEAVVMTNNPFDPQERPVWDEPLALDPRFKTALRIDDLLLNWKGVCGDLKAWGYKVKPTLDKNVYAEIRRFLNDWIDRIDPVYFAASLPPDFAFPDSGPCGSILEHCVLPVGEARRLPFAMMIGVRRGINPLLRMAGDGLGLSNTQAVETICSGFPNNKFMITMLARENQHELCIVARKFRNLMLFGCWWFLNNPSMIREMTTMRLELLGTGFIPQHSDCRVLDQLIYKWEHSRAVIADALIEKYDLTMSCGWPVTKASIKQDVADLFGGNFKRFIGAETPAAS